MIFPDLMKRLDAIESELRRLGFLKGELQQPQVVKSAFGYGQISFEQWLGHVFLPNARSAAESGEIPSVSNVGIAAIRNFDGYDEASELISMLCEFDERIAVLSKSCRLK